MSDESRPPSAEDAIIDARRAQAREVRARGENPFANDVTARDGRTDVRHRAKRARSRAPRRIPSGDTTTDGCRSLAGDARLHVRGRVMALRSTGGLSFLRLRDRTGEIQLLVSQAALGSDYERLAEIDVGDVDRGRGRADREQARRAVDRASQAPAPDEGVPTPARKVARADRRRAALSPALRRPRRQPPRRGRLPRAEPHRGAPFARSSTSTGFSRSRRRRCTRSSAARRRGRSSRTTTRSTCASTCASRRSST